VLASSDGSVYVTFFKDTTLPNTTSVISYPHLLKFNSSGGLVWDRTDISTWQLCLDPQGNLFAFVSTGAPVAFRKYSSNGDVLYTREITSGLTIGSDGFPYMESLLSVDWLGQPQLMIHTPSETRLTTNPANNLNKSLTYASRVWYDAAGGLLGAESLSGSIRERFLYFRARGTNEFVYTRAFASLSGFTTYGWVSRGFGAFTGTAQCYFPPSARSADFDRSNAAYFGETYVTPHPNCMPTPVLPQSTGADMVFIRTTTLGNSIYSTNGNGNTNERDVTLAVDTAGRYLFAVGNWSKGADTSHFRFGSSDLTNGGATGTTDFLFLKFKIGNVPLKARAGQDKRTCPGGYTNLDGSAEGGSGNYSYSWSPAVGLSSTTVANPTVTPDSTRAYILTVTDNEGAVAYDTVMVTVDSNFFRPAIILTSGSNPFCEGNSITLQASGGTNYIWSDGNTFTNRVVLKSDTLTVTATGPQGCVATSLPYIAVMNPAPVPPVISPAGSELNLCQGSTAILTASHPDPTAQFTWTPGNATTSSITVGTAGLYSVRVRVSGNSCISSDDQINVRVTPPPTATLSAGGSTTFCEGDSVQLAVSTAAGNTILWSNGATTQSIWVKASGTYSAQVSSPGCTITTNSIAVSVKPKPVTPTISASGNTTFCSGGDVTLTASTSTGGVSWQWSNGATTSSITVNASGTYSVAASLDGCPSASASTPVTVNPAPTGSISSSGNTTFCQGGNVQLNVSTAPGNSILWSNGATIPSITVNTSGTYSAQITSPSGCTINTNSITVTVNSKPATPTVSASGSTTFCSGSSVTLTASSSTGGVSWQWSNGATTSSISVNASGTYTATASINGCTAASAGTTVTVNPLPTGSISASGSTSFCEGDSVQLSVSTAPGNNILWSNGATTQSIWVKTGGTYSVQLTSAQGCTATTNSISTTVLQKPSPVIGQSGNELSVSPAASAYQWYLNGSSISGATGQTITISQGGDYSVVVTGSNGCTATAYHSAVFRVNTPFIVYQAYPNPVTADLRLAYTLKEGGQVTFTIVNDQGASKSWSSR
jgi:hypothetical protein